MSHTGTVKFYNEQKGYGFIKDDSTSQDVFVHISALNGARALETGEKVSFDIVDGKKGKAAANVKGI